MINLSRQAALGIAALLSLLLVLTLALGVSALAMRAGPTVAEAVSATVPASTTEAATAEVVATATATDTPEPTSDTPTPETASDTPTATARPIPTPITPGNLLGNESFELPPDEVETRWSFDSRASAADGAWSDTVARTGARALSVTTNTAPQGGWPGWTTTDMIPIESGKTYTFSAWASSSDRSNAWLRVDLYDAQGAFLVGFGTGCITLQTANEWQQLTVVASDQNDGAAGATQVKLELALCSPGGSGIGTTVYYDDVFFGTTATATETPTDTPTATATPEPPTATPAPDNLLGNESFDQPPDQAETRWSFDSRASAADGAWSDTVARTGARALSVTTNTTPQGGWPGWTTADMIPIESGKTYTFSAWAYSPNRSNAWIRVDMYDGNGTFLVGFSTGCTPLQASSQWQQLSVTASDQSRNAAGATQVRLRLQQCSPGGSGIGTTVYYDDVFFGVTSP